MPKTLTPGPERDRPESFIVNLLFSNLRMPNNARSCPYPEVSPEEVMPLGACG